MNVRLLYFLFIQIYVYIFIHYHLPPLHLTSTIKIFYQTQPIKAISAFKRKLNSEIIYLFNRIE